MNLRELIGADLDRIVNALNPNLVQIVVVGSVLNDRNIARDIDLVLLYRGSAYGEIKQSLKNAGLSRLFYCNSSYGCNPYKEIGVMTYHFIPISVDDANNHFLAQHKDSMCVLWQAGSPCP